MSLINACLIFFIIIVVVHAYNRNYFSGMNLSIFFAVLTPYNIFFELPGELPNLTIHRIIVILMVIFWVKKHQISKTIHNIPFNKSFILVLISILTSTLFSVVFLKSFKTLLSVVFEQFVFYVVVYSSITSLKDEDRRKVQISFISSIVSAITLVAAMGVLERWTGFNPVTRYLPNHAVTPSFYAGQLHGYSGRVTSTYPDPILLGYGLSMSWPLVFVLMNFVNNTGGKKALTLSFFLIGSCTYFTGSRGPWLASILAGMTLFVLGTHRFRKRLLLAGLLLLTILTVRPQITNTITSLVRDTTDITSFKGRSFNYRLELWGKAYSEISKSSLRFLLGYGDLSHEFVDWSGIEKKTGRFSYFWSWDNEYAATLLDRGFIGLILFSFLFLSIVFKSYRKFRSTSVANKDLMAALFSAIIVFVFMMTNVMVFSPQLHFLFWLVVSLALTLGQESNYGVQKTGRLAWQQ